MLAGGSRVSHHLRECDHQHMGLRFCVTRIVQLSSLMCKPPSSAHFPRNRMSSCYNLAPESRREQLPVLSDSSSHQEHAADAQSEGFSAIAGGIVALGKFEALHIGHRELAIQASKAGAPFLLSFVGMGQVLGWEPRTPIIGKCDRPRVLSSWAQYCGNVAPIEFEIEFSTVRCLTPRQFVEKLAQELGVKGVVAGENYRFGYKAAGDASELVRLCEEYGMNAYVIGSVMDKNQDLRHLDTNNNKKKEQGQVSSTRVRYALADGDMNYVSELLGRPHRLILATEDPQRFTCSRGRRVSAPKTCLLNLAPRNGVYDSCWLVIGTEKNLVPCRVAIDTTNVHVQVDEEGFAFDFVSSEGIQMLQIEFGGS